MAYSRKTKEDALNLYIAGKNREQLAAELGVAPSTVLRWYEQGVPRPWDAARQEVEESARRKASERLATEKANLSVTHFRNLAVLADLAMLTVCDVVDGDGDGKVYKPKDGVSPKDAKDATTAFRAAQEGQRLAVGMTTAKVGVETKAPTNESGPADSEVLALEEALANATAGAGGDDEPGGS
jgi:hypothetical protein